jgi:AAA domain
LIIIDEAGMADPLSLDTAVEFAIDHGASVRLIGDDQQFAAIGAGGILSDIKQTHGALQLTEPHRFTNRPVLPSSSGVQMSPRMQRWQPSAPRSSLHGDRRVKWGVSDHARSRRRLERWVRTSCRRRRP